MHSLDVAMPPKMVTVEDVAAEVARAARELDWVRRHRFLERRVRHSPRLRDLVAATLAADEYLYGKASGRSVAAGTVIPLMGDAPYFGPPRPRRRHQLQAVLDNWLQ